MSRVKAGEAYVEIGGDPRKLFATLGKVNKQIGQLGQSAAAGGAKLAAVGGAIVAPILGAAQAFANIGSALNDMSKRTGVAAESLSVLKFAAEQTGTDMAGVETAVRKMQKAIYAAGHGSKEAAAALEMVGLSARDLAGLSADRQMGKIADGLLAIEDPGTRAAVAMQIFGKAGTMILPMLEGGSAGMAAFADEAKRLGLVMDNETAEKADALGDAIDALKAAMQMAFIQVGSAVAPILTDIAKKLASGAAAVGKFISENQQLVVSLLKWGATAVAAGGGLIALGKSIKFTSAAFGGIHGTAGGVFSVLKTVAGGALFVGNSFAKAITGILAFRVASITSAVASGAAWAIANAPLLILLGLLGGLAVFAIKAMGGFNALTGAIGGYFKGAIADAQVVFGDLYKIGKETLGGIYDAIANGDLQGAMQILVAGLSAIWTRSIEGLVSTWYSAVGKIKKAFITIGSAWDTYVTKPISLAGAMIGSATERRRILQEVGGKGGGSISERHVRKQVASDLLNSQNVEDYTRNKKRVESLIQDRQAIVDAGQVAGATQEQKDAAKVAAQEIRALNDAIALMRATFAQVGIQTPEERQAEIDRRRAEVDAQTEQNKAGINLGGRAAQENLDKLTRDQRDQRSFRAQADEAINQVGSATTMEQVRQIAEEFHLLASTGKLAAEQQKKYAEAVEAAQERIEAARGESGVGGAGTTPVDPEALRKAAAEAAASQSEVAGTFSAASVNGMGFGQSLQQKQLDEQKKTNDILERKLGEGAVAA